MLASMPMIATAISNSISVKPPWQRFCVIGGGVTGSSMNSLQPVLAGDMIPRHEVSVYSPIGREVHVLEARCTDSHHVLSVRTGMRPADSQGLAVFFDFLLPEGASSQFVELEFLQFFCPDYNSGIPGFWK